jgi:hypothetical protein
MINLTLSILNSIFTVVFYATRWIKQDLSCICFEEFLNQLDLLYIYIYLYLQCILNSIFTVALYAMRGGKKDFTYIYFKEFLNQPNLDYICICYIFATDQELWARELMSRIMGCDHSLGQKDILKFVYSFMILFLIVYIFKHFLLLVSCNQQGSAIMLSF